jgi:hypothetical protein
MKRPMDPRKHGLKEPSQTIIEDHKIRVPHGSDNRGYYDNTARCSLDTAVELWAEHKTNTFRSKKSIVDGPFLDSTRGEMSLVFKTTMRNLAYSREKAEYDAQVKEYEDKCLAYEDSLKRKEAGIKEKIDVQILRLEHKLANLKAVRNEEPVPFPDD